MKLLSCYSFNSNIIVMSYDYQNTDANRCLVLFTESLSSSLLEGGRDAPKGRFPDLLPFKSAVGPFENPKGCSNLELKICKLQHEQRVHKYYSAVYDLGAMMLTYTTHAEAR